MTQKLRLPGRRSQKKTGIGAKVLGSTLGSDPEFAHLSADEIENYYEFEIVEGDTEQEEPTMLSEAAKTLMECFSGLISLPGRRRKKQERRKREMTQALCAKINLKVDECEKKVDVLNISVAKCVKSNDRMMAKQHLISRKRIEKQLKSYRAYANDLAAISMTMEEQEDQVEFTKSLASASKMIKKSRIRGQIDTVDEFNDAMTEASDDRAELDDALSTGRMWSDESDIESELADIFEDDTPSAGSAPLQALELPVAPKNVVDMSEQEFNTIMESVAIP